MKPTTLFALVLSFLVLSLPAAAAEDAGAPPPSEPDVEAGVDDATNEEDGLRRPLLLADLRPFDPHRLGTANVVFTEQGCTITDDCPDGSTIQCSGTSCHSAFRSCPDGGSTCPEQGGTTKAVKCDGVIRDYCPCPQVCYGCGASCQDMFDCAAACSCGPGFCDGGSCICPH